MWPEIDPDDADLFDGRENRSLLFVLAPIADPTTEGAVALPLELHEADWWALFVDVLDVPVTEWFKLSRERQRIEFRKALTEYPMLAEIWDVYADAAFLPEELPQLRSECLRVKAKTSQPDAVKALRKLIYACDEATKRGFCLLLVGD